MLVGVHGDPGELLYPFSKAVELSVFSMLGASRGLGCLLGCGLPGIDSGKGSKLFSAPRPLGVCGADRVWPLGVWGSPDALRVWVRACQSRMRQATQEYRAVEFSDGCHHLPRK